MGSATLQRQSHFPWHLRLRRLFPGLAHVNILIGNFVVDAQELDLSTVTRQLDKSATLARQGQF
jgi:hypothetical protein